MSFAAKLRDYKILKRIGVNPGNWRWNLCQLSWPVLCTDQAMTKFDGFEIFNADGTDETKICHDIISSLILSGKF